jgi:hypothetical protein
MTDKSEKGAQLAGLVLAVLGVLTYGATSPFGLVLCAEWIRDPARSLRLRVWDWVGLILAIPGTAFFLWLSVSMFDYAPGGASFGAMVAGYWVAFLVWLLVRMRVR